MICKFFNMVIVSAIILIASMFASAADFSTPSMLTPLNQPPRQTGKQIAQPVNDVIAVDQPVEDNVIMVDPAPETGTPTIDPIGGNPVNDTETGFVPEPEKKTDEGSTSVTKPASSEYFVRVIPVTKMNLATLSRSLGVKTANVNNSKATTSNDWWSDSANAPTTTDTSGTSGGTAGNFANTKLKDSQEDIKRLMTIYQAVDYDYQQLYKQAFNMTVLKDASITAAIRDLRVKHDKLASDINDRWRLSDTKAINAMQDRVMAFQTDIDDIRAMDDSLKSPTAQNGLGTGGATDINSQLQQVQTAYQQAMTQFANNPRYLTQLNSVKADIATAQNAITSGGTGTTGKKGGKGGNNNAATRAIQAATTTLASLGIQINGGTNQIIGNPLLNGVNPVINPGLYGNNGINNG
ncbi:MAG: hypothetical protein WCO98_12470, partial [bacterium]